MKHNSFLILLLTAALIAADTAPAAAYPLRDNATEELVIPDEEETPGLSDIEEDEPYEIVEEDIADIPEDLPDDREEREDETGPEDTGEEAGVNVVVVEEVVEIIEDEKGLSDEADEDDDEGQDEKRKVKSGPPQFAPPRALPALSGDWRSDFVEVSRSQIGYSEAGDGSSYFGNRYGMTYGAWCTAFVSFCAASAGIPKSIIPRVLNSTKYVEFYAPKGQFYFVKGGIAGADTRFIREHAFDDAENIKATSMEPGDILLFDTDKNPDDGPDHTAIFIGLSDDGRGIVNLSGNSNNSVNITTKDISTLFGVCSPTFDREELEPEGARITSVTNTKAGIRIKWDECEGASGYEVYARRPGDPDAKDYVQQTDINSVYRDRSWVFEGVENKETLYFFVRPYFIAGDTDQGERIYGERSARKKGVFLKRSPVKNIVKSDDGSMTLEWRKNSECSGYQIQCGTDKDFNDYRSLTVARPQTTTMTISGLDPDLSYYVRIRPFVNVKDRTFYGAWKKYPEEIRLTD